MEKFPTEEKENLQKVQWSKENNSIYKKRHKQMESLSKSKSKIKDWMQNSESETKALPTDLTKSIKSIRYQR